MFKLQRILTLSSIRCWCPVRAETRKRRTRWRPPWTIWTASWPRTTTLPDPGWPLQTSPSLLPSHSWRPWTTDLRDTGDWDYDILEVLQNFGTKIGRPTLLKKRSIIFFTKMGHPQPLFHLFLVFFKQTTIQFYLKLMWKMSIQYKALGF